MVFLDPYTQSSVFLCEMSAQQRTQNWLERNNIVHKENLLTSNIDRNQERPDPG